MTLEEALHSSIFQSIVGSQSWGMARPDSDTDLFVVYTASPFDLLAGRTQHGSFFDQSVPGVDYQVHEAGRVVEQILKGNVNFIQGITSPCSTVCNRQGFDLRRLVMENPAQNCYESIRAMAKSNYKKYMERPEAEAFDPSPKRCGTIVRNLRFGATLLRTGRFEYRNPGPCTVADVESAMEELEKAKAESTLPEAPAEAPYREWLLNLRMSQVACLSLVTLHQ